MEYPKAIAPDGRSVVCHGVITGYEPGSVPESILMFYDLSGLYGGSE
jgi:hypothetical protein